MVRSPLVFLAPSGFAFLSASVLRWSPNNEKANSIGGHLSTIKRDKSPKGDGQSPQFRMRISPELKEQFDKEAQSDGISLANWLKELGRKELLRRGIEPKG